MAEIELLAAEDLLNEEIVFEHQEGRQSIPLSKDASRPTRVDLMSGTYNLYPASANHFPSTVTVREDGTIQYDPEMEGVLSGNASNRLTFNGLPVTIDARYISGIQTGENEFTGGGAGAHLVLINPPIVRFQECRILPQRYGYSLYIGAARVSPFALFLDHRTGHWSYGVVEDGELVEDASFDISEGGFLGGRGTNTLEIFGYPCIVDARESGAKSLQIIGVGPGETRLRSTDTLVQYLNLLPIGRAGEIYEVLLGDGVRGRGFQVNVHGELIPVGPGVTINAFHQIPLVRIA